MKMTNRELSEIDAINMVFEEHGVLVEIDSRSLKHCKRRRHVTPTCVIYDLTIFGPGVKLSKVRGLQPELQEEISNIRRAPTPIRIGENPLCVEVPRTDPQIKRLGAEHYQGLRENEAIIGRSFIYGKPETQTLYLPDPNQAHTLIAGMTGSGKSNLAQAAILSLAFNTSPDLLHMLMIDPKNRSLVPLRSLPHVRAWTNSPDEARQLLAWVGEEIVRRRDGESPSPTPRVWVIVEELAELEAQGVDLRQLESAARLGRELGVHIMALAQKPTRGDLGNQLMSQFNVRVVGLMQNSQDAYWATGHKASGAESLPGRGAMLIVRDGAHPVRVQSYFVEEPILHVDAVLEKWGAVSVLPLDLAQVSMPTKGRRSDLVKDVERSRSFLSDHMDWQRGKLRHGKKQELIRLLAGEGATLSGDNDRWASDVIALFVEDSYAK